MRTKLRKKDQTMELSPHQVKEQIQAIIAKVVLVTALFFSSLASAVNYQGIEFPQGESSFIDELITYSPGSEVVAPYNDPSSLPGPPTNAYTWFALGNEGSVIGKFTDNSLIASGDSGIDLWVFEIGSAIEPTDVFISENGTSWIYVGKTSGATSGVDIDAYIGQGVEVGKKYFYVKLVDLLPKQSGNPWAGADIDAIGAISSGPRGTEKNTCDTTLHPCQISTGAKLRNETDFSYGNFIFTRNYHSLNLDDTGFGKGWHNQYLKRLSVSNDTLAIYEGTGRGEPWTKVNGVWAGDADSDYLITESTSGYTVTLKRGDIHEYDQSGILLSETDTQGKVKTYEYDVENRLIKVSNHYQQSITFTYSTDGKNHITQVVDAQGVEYGYEYDTNDNLIAVIYPDEDSDPANNPKRIYHYEDTNFPNHITGITNANGERYATFAYDATGKAIESALAPTTNPVGQQRVQLNYQGAN